MQQHFMFHEGNTDVQTIDWRLDEPTKASGRAGVAEARQILASLHHHSEAA